MFSCVSNAISKPIFKTTDQLTRMAHWIIAAGFKSIFWESFDDNYYRTTGVDKNGKEVKNLSSPGCCRFFKEREFAEWSIFDEYVQFSKSVRFVKIN